MSDSNRLMLPPLKVAFAKLNEPQAYQGKGARKYSIVMLIPKNDKALVKKIESFIQKNIAATDHAGGVKQRCLKAAVTNKDPDNDLLIIKDGDEKLDADGETYSSETKPFYIDHYYINLKRHEKMGAPGLFGPDNKQLPPEVISSEIYGGAEVKVQVSAYVYTTPKAGCSLSLEAVQKYRDGEKFGQASPFDVVETDDEDDEEFDFDADEKKPPMGAKRKSTPKKKRPAKRAAKKKKPARKKRR